MTAAEALLEAPDRERPVPGASRTRPAGRPDATIASETATEAVLEAVDRGRTCPEGRLDAVTETEAILAQIDREGLAPRTFDLHVHTTVSDGSESFKQVLKLARAHGLEGIAFTNHDSTVGLDYARDLGDDFGMTVIGGIEISAWDARRGRKVHILGYGLHSDSPAIEALCRPLRKRRTENTLWQLERLVEAGLIRDRQSALDNAASSTAFYKQHLMAALTDEPHASPAYRELYRALFKGEGMCVRDIDYVDARDAVAAILEDGGVPVLAHPGQLDSYDFVPELADCGLKGIEKFHPDHGSADHARCDDLAVRFALLRTGGSDYHGAYGEIPHPGFTPAASPNEAAD